jgi:hypothetical protein
MGIASHADVDLDASVTEAAEVVTIRGPRWLKGNPVLTERWIEDRIAADPAILNLGEFFGSGSGHSLVLDAWTCCSKIPKH